MPRSLFVTNRIRDSGSFARPDGLAAFGKARRSTLQDAVELLRQQLPTFFHCLHQYFIASTNACACSSQ